ncbi:MATE family efflux transporter [Atopobacter phocae]|uniref:MATE family efflux transporter n=1 Tax=Atopobacter phocae TaxID=136492 RepID=UPI00047259FD|nr:MATE family efflux transporter [Atopobacter phocae]
MQEIDRSTVWQQFVQYVSASVFGLLGVSVYILADTYYIANGIGVDGLAALNIALPIWSLISAVGLLIGMGSSIYFAIHSHQTIRRQAYSTSVILGIVIGLCLSAIGWLSLPILTTSLGATDELISLTMEYLRVVLPLAPIFITNTILSSFLRNDGAPRRAMATQLIGSFLNIILDYVFIYTFQWGMMGAALATGMSPIVGLLIAYPHFKRHAYLQLRIKWFQLELIPSMLSLGSATFLLELSGGVVLFVFNHLLIAVSGNLAVAAYGVIANVALVTNALFTGISQGTQPLLSRYFNGKVSDTTQQFYHLARYVVIGLSIVMYALLYIYAPAISALFNAEESTVLNQLATEGIRLYFLSLPLTGLNVLNVMALSAINQPRFSLFFSLLRGLFIIIPMGMILSYWFGLQGIWSAVLLTEICVWVLSYRYHLNHYRTRVELPHEVKEV